LTGIGDGIPDCGVCADIFIGDGVLGIGEVDGIGPVAGTRGDGDTVVT
jgi:hypothetical protein